VEYKGGSGEVLWFPQPARKLLNGMAPPMAKPVSAYVDHDAAEPLFEVIGVAECAEMTPCEDGSVVGGIFRIDWVAEDDARQPVGRIEVAIGQP
jgi:hypothetical protein